MLSEIKQLKMTQNKPNNQSLSHCENCHSRISQEQFQLIKEKRDAVFCSYCGKNLFLKKNFHDNQNLKKEFLKDKNSSNINQYKRESFEYYITIFAARIIYDSITQTNLCSKPIENYIDKLAHSLRIEFSEKSLNKEWLGMFRNNSKKKFKKRYNEFQTILKRNMKYQENFLIYSHPLIKSVLELKKNEIELTTLKGIKRDIAEDLINRRLFERDKRFTEIFKQNLMIALSRLIYIKMKYMAQKRKVKISLIDLDLKVIAKMAETIKNNIINFTEINPEYLKKIYGITLQQFNAAYQNLRAELKVSKIYSESFRYLLQRLIKKVNLLLSGKQERASLTNLEQVLISELKNLEIKLQNYPNLILESSERKSLTETNEKEKLLYSNNSKEKVEPDKNDYKNFFNSSVLKILKFLEENFEDSYSIYDLSKEINLHYGTINTYLNKLLNAGFVEYKKEGRKKIWRAIKKVPKEKEIYEDVTVKKLKQLFEKFDSYAEVSRFLKKEGYRKAYHPYVISKKIRESFNTEKEYEKWLNHVKVNKLKRYAELNGGNFRGNKYLGAQKPHKFYCPKHKKEFETTPDCLINRGHWCPKCGYEKAGEKQRTDIKELKKIILKKEGKLISTTFKNNYDPLTVECKMGHRFSILPKTLKKGAWCDICSAGINERLTRKIFEHIFDVKFPKSRPKWLISPKGFQMHYDGYNENLGIAFEFQGIQHYKFHPFFHKTKNEYFKQKAIDLIKKKLSKEHSIHLIEVPYYIEKDKRFKYILNECKKRGIKNFQNLKQISWKDFSIHLNTEKFQNYKNLASKMGFTLISTYTGYYEDVELKCNKCGLKIQVTPRILNSKKRDEKRLDCPNCKFRDKISKFVSKIKNKEGELIKFKFKGKRKRLYFFIKCLICGYEWWIREDNIIGDFSWCPKCSGKEKRTLKRINQFAKKYNAVCLTKERINKHYYFTFKCNSCGHKWKSTYDQMKTRSYFCPNCRNNR